MSPRDDCGRSRVLRSRYALVIAVAALGTACGAAVESDSGPGGPSTQGEAETVSSEGDPGIDRPGSEVLASGGGFMFGFSATEPNEKRAIDEVYSVFARPRNDADRRAGRLAARWGSLDMGEDPDDATAPPPGVSNEDWAAMQPGDVLEGEGRLLLEGLGGQEDKVYAAPTTNGHICHALLPNGGGGCGAPGPEGLNLNYSYSPSAGLVVYGLVGDEIASVDVVVAGETSAARMGENAFGIRLEGTRPDLDRIVLHRRDGSENVIDLGFTGSD